MWELDLNFIKVSDQYLTKLRPKDIDLLLQLDAKLTNDTNVKTFKFDENNDQFEIEFEVDRREIKFINKRINSISFDWINNINWKWFDQNWNIEILSESKKVRINVFNVEQPQIVYQLEVDELNNEQVLEYYLLLIEHWTKNFVSKFDQRISRGDYGWINLNETSIKEIKNKDACLLINMCTFSKNVINVKFDTNKLDNDDVKNVLFKWDGEDYIFFELLRVWNSDDNWDKFNKILTIKRAKWIDIKQFNAWDWGLVDYGRDDIISRDNVYENIFNLKNVYTRTKKWDTPVKN